VTVVELAIIIPVLGRAHQIEPVLASISAATDVPHRIVFVCSPGDTEAKKACSSSGADTIVVDWKPDKGDFAKKVNLAYSRSSEEWFFQAATDLKFHPKWASLALSLAQRRRVGVVGTNDLGNAMVKRGQHSTHTFFSREYIETFGGTYDNSGVVFSEEYDHQFCDTEFIQTALDRKQFAPSLKSIVEHNHPHWGKSPMDPTYDKSMRDFKGDAEVYRGRMRDMRNTALKSRTRRRSVHR